MSKTTVKLDQLKLIAFAQPGQTSLMDRLYTQKPERGGSKVAYRIAALRGTCLRLLGEGSAFESRRKALIDEYFETSEAGEQQVKEPGADNLKAFEAEMKAVFDSTEEIDTELFSIDVLDAAGYLLTGAEIDALMGLLVASEAIPA